MFKDKNYLYKGMNLQLFAGDVVIDEDDDVLIPDGNTGDDDEEDKDPIDAEEDKDPDEELEEDFEAEEDPGDEEPKKPTKKVDKVTAALIEAKREIKELKRKQQAIDDANASAAESIANEQKIKELIGEGYGEARAKQMVESDSNNAKLMLEVQKLKFEKLEPKYPGISTHTKEILEIQMKTNGALTVEEIYNAKFRTSSEYDIKVNAEAAAMHKQKQAQKKKGTDPSGDRGDRKPTTLSSSDEKAFKHLQKQFPTLTKAQYLKSSRGGELEE